MVDENTLAENAVKWWLVRDGKPDGPYSEAYVVVSLEKRAVACTTLGCPVGGNEWRPLHQWPCFASFESQKDDSAHAPPPFPASLTRPPQFNASAQLWKLLTNPRLPPMANWICVYCLAASPCSTILDRAAFGVTSGTHAESPAFELALAWGLLTLTLDLGITVFLFIGGLKLRHLKSSAPTLLIVGLYVSLGLLIFEFVIGVLISVIETAIDPNNSGDLTTGDAIKALLALGIGAALVGFQIVALVWLHRNHKRLPLDEAAQ